MAPLVKRKPFGTMLASKQVDEEVPMVDVGEKVAAEEGGKGVSSSSSSGQVAGSDSLSLSMKAEMVLDVSPSMARGILKHPQTAESQSTMHTPEKVKPSGRQGKMDPEDGDSGSDESAELEVAAVQHTPHEKDAELELQQDFHHDIESHESENNEACSQIEEVSPSKPHGTPDADIAVPKLKPPSLKGKTAVKKGLLSKIIEHVEPPTKLTARKTAKTAAQAEATDEQTEIEEALAALASSSKTFADLAKTQELAVVGSPLIEAQPFKAQVRRGLNFGAQPASAGIDKVEVAVSRRGVKKVSEPGSGAGQSTGLQIPNGLGSDEGYQEQSEEEEELPEKKERAKVARKRKMSDEPVSRGMCPWCHGDVMSDQARLIDESTGEYFHTECCIKNNPGVPLNEIVIARTGNVAIKTDKKKIQLGKRKQHLEDEDAADVGALAQATLKKQKSFGGSFGGLQAPTSVSGAAKTKIMKKTAKKEKGPKRPMSADKNPTATFGEIGKLLGEAWAACSNQDKFNVEAAQLKAEFAQNYPELVGAKKQRAKSTKKATGKVSSRGKSAKQKESSEPSEGEEDDDEA